MYLCVFVVSSCIVVLTVTSPQCSSFLRVQSHGARLGVKPSLYAKELSYHVVDGCYLLLWRACFLSRVSDDHQGFDVDCPDLVLPIQLT